MLPGRSWAPSASCRNRNRPNWCRSRASCGATESRGRRRRPRRRRRRPTTTAAAGCSSPTGRGNRLGTATHTHSASFNESITHTHARAAHETTRENPLPLENGRDADRIKVSLVNGRREEPKKVGLKKYISAATVGSEVFWLKTLIY